MEEKVEVGDISLNTVELKEDEDTFISHNENMKSIIELHMFYNRMMNDKQEEKEDNSDVYVEEFVDRYKSNLSTHMFSVKKFSPENNRNRVRTLFMNYVSDILFVEYKNYEREKEKKSKTPYQFEFTQDDLFFLITLTVNIIEEVSVIVNHYTKYGNDETITTYPFLLEYIKQQKENENIVLSLSPKKYLDENIVEIANAFHKIMELKGENKQKVVLSLLKKTILHIYREFYGEVIHEIQSIELSYYMDLLQNGVVANIIDTMVNVSKGNVYLNTMNDFVTYTREILQRKKKGCLKKSCCIQ